MLLPLFVQGISSAKADMFAVSGITVDRTARSAVAARSLGLNAAHQKAWNQLMERLVDPKRLTDIPIPDRTTLENLTAEFRIVDERSSTVRYLAVVDYRFDRESVLAWLNQNNLPHINREAAPTLLIPVWREDSRIFLWESENIWLEVWKSLAPHDNPAPLQLPNHDLNDLLKLSAAHISPPDTSALAAMAEDYGTIFYYVSLAERDPQTGQIHISTFGQGPLGSVARRDHARPLIADQPETETLREAALALIRHWNNQWRAAVLNEQSDLKTRIAFSVRFTSPEEWGLLWRRLNDIIGLSLIEINAFSASGADISAVFQGNIDQMRQTLVQNRLAMQKNRRKRWWVSLAP